MSQCKRPHWLTRCTHDWKEGIRDSGLSWLFNPSSRLPWDLSFIKAFEVRPFHPFHLQFDSRQITLTGGFQVLIPVLIEQNQYPVFFYTLPSITRLCISPLAVAVAAVLPLWLPSTAEAVLTRCSAGADGPPRVWYFILHVD